MLTLLFVPISRQIFERYGLRAGATTGAALQCLGTWVRVVGGFSFGGKPRGFGWQFTGQTMVAVSTTLFLSTPALLSLIWFPQEQRGRATAIGVFGSNFGLALSYIIVPLAVKVGQDIPSFLLYSAFCQTLVAILKLLFFSPDAASAFMFQQDDDKSMPLLDNAPQLNVNMARAADEIGWFESNSPLFASDSLSEEFEADASSDSLQPDSGAPSTVFAPPRASFHSRSSSLVQEADRSNLPGSPGSPGSLGRRRGGRGGPDDGVEAETEGVWAGTLRILRDPSYIAMTAAYGLMIGGLFGLHAYLPALLLEVYPHETDVTVGWLGFTATIAGMVGSLAFGEALDQFRFAFRSQLFLDCSTCRSARDCFDSVVSR